MNRHTGPDAPVVVMASPRPGAVTWAAGYAHRRGSPLRVLHTTPHISALLDDLRAAFPGLPVDQRQVVEPIGEALVSASEHAHSIVIADSGDDVFEEEFLTTALSRRAECPVISVPPNAVWDDHVAPVIVGARRRERTPRKLEFAFAEAQRLGTGVRVVRCAPSRRGGTTEDLARLVEALVARYPDVPVHTEVPATSASSAVAWHAHFGSMVVVGARRGSAVRRTLSRSISRTVLRSGSSPVVVIGGRARRTSPSVSELGSARS